jgi:hypothetical protein
MKIVVQLLNELNIKIKGEQFKIISQIFNF